MEDIIVKFFKIFAFGLMAYNPPILAEGLFSFGGKSFSEKDLTPAQQQQMFEIQAQSYEQTKAAIDAFILELHVTEEAGKQNKPKEEIEKKMFDVKEPSDKTIKSWYDENKSRIPPNYQFDQIKGEISKIVKQEEMKKKRDVVLEKIKKDKKFSLAVVKPEAPMVDIKADGFPSKGKDGAKVTIVEFADYQCPHCKAAADSLKKVTEKFKDKVKYIFIDFPINHSGISKIVAEASHCAAEQNKFWEFHYKAFESQASLDKDSPAKIAKDLKLDDAKFKACTEGTKGKAMVEKGRTEGERIGVSGTPYLVINGRRYMGAHTIEAMTKEIETALK
jgi:protein-disulfide isomerase